MSLSSIADIAITSIQYSASIMESRPDFNFDVAPEITGPVYNAMKLGQTVLNAISPILASFQVYFTITAVIAPMLMVFIGIFSLNPVRVLIFYILFLVGILLTVIGAAGKIILASSALKVDVSDFMLLLCLIVGPSLIAICGVCYSFRDTLLHVGAEPPSDKDTVEERMKDETESIGFFTFLQRFLGAAAFIFFGLVFIGIIPTFDIFVTAGSDFAPLAFGFGIALVVVGGLVFIYMCVGLFQCGRELQWKLGAFLEDNFMRLFLIMLSILYIPMVAPVFLVFNCNEMTCPADYRLQDVGSVLPANRTTDALTSGVCQGCVVAPQQLCPAALQATACVSATESRLESEPAIRCETLQTFFWPAAGFMIIASVIGIPLIFYYLTKQSVEILEEKFPIKDLTPEEMKKKKEGGTKKNEGGDEGDRGEDDANNKGAAAAPAPAAPGPQAAKYATTDAAAKPDESGATTGVIVVVVAEKKPADTPSSPEQQQQQQQQQQRKEEEEEEEDEDLTEEEKAQKRWRKRVHATNNVARFLYQPFLPEARYTRLFFLIQKLVSVFLSQFVIRIFGWHPTWISIGSQIFVHFVGFLGVVITFPFLYAFENGVAIAMEVILTVTSVLSVLLFAQITMPGWVLITILICNGVLPAIALIIAIILEWSSKAEDDEEKEKKKEEELQKEIEKKKQEQKDKLKQEEEERDAKEKWEAAFPDTPFPGMEEAKKALAQQQATVQASGSGSPPTKSTSDADAAAATAGNDGKKDPSSNAFGPTLESGPQEGEHEEEDEEEDDDSDYSFSDDSSWDDSDSDIDIDDLMADADGTAAAELKEALLKAVSDLKKYKELEEKQEEEKVEREKAEKSKSGLFSPSGSAAIASSPTDDTKSTKSTKSNKSNKSNKSEDEEKKKKQEDGKEEEEKKKKKSPVMEGETVPVVAIGGDNTDTTAADADADGKEKKKQQKEDDDDTPTKRKEEKHHHHHRRHRRKHHAGDETPEESPAESPCGSPKSVEMKPVIAATAATQDASPAPVLPHQAPQQEDQPSFSPSPLGAAFNRPGAGTVVPSYTPPDDPFANLGNTFSPKAAAAATAADAKPVILSPETNNLQPETSKKMGGKRRRSSVGGKAGGKRRKSYGGLLSAPTGDFTTEESDAVFLMEDGSGANDDDDLPEGFAFMSKQEQMAVRRKLARKKNILKERKAKKMKALEALLEKRREEAEQRLQNCQNNVDFEINLVVKDQLNTALMGMGVLGLLALAACAVALLSSPTLFDGAVIGIDGDRTNSSEFLNFANWSTFVRSCCCTATFDPNSTTAYVAVEKWICADGTIKERVRAYRPYFKLNGSKSAVDGFAVRSLCNVSFADGCGLVGAAGTLPTNGGVTCAESVGATFFMRNFLW